MARNLPLYSVKVKNTFIDTGVAEDDDLNAEDAMCCRGLIRQMSEPITPTCESLKEVQKHKFFVAGEKSDTSTTDSCVDNRSTLDDPSDDSSNAEQAPEKQNEVECKEWADSQESWRLTEQYWPAWSDKEQEQVQWVYVVPGQAAPGDWSGYGMEQFCWDGTYEVPSCYPSMKLAANALAAAAVDAREPVQNVSKVSAAKARTAKRANKRESLIDRAAKQTQEELQKDKEKNRQKFIESASASTKAEGGKSCSKCGGSNKGTSKFCQFCGAALSSTSP